MNTFAQFQTRVLRYSNTIVAPELFTFIYLNICSTSKTILHTSFPYIHTYNKYIILYMYVYAYIQFTDSATIFI